MSRFLAWLPSAATAAQQPDKEGRLTDACPKCLRSYRGLHKKGITKCVVIVDGGGKTSFFVKFFNMVDECYHISSELYEEFDYSSSSKPSVDKENVVSKFLFHLPQYAVTDNDGDLIVPRKKSNIEILEKIEIEHSSSTILDLVGLQVWRGSLLLADWLLQNGRQFSSDSYVLELGSGVGLASIVAAMFSPVLCTDVDRGDIFKIINSNVARNKHISRHKVDVFEVDFKQQELPQHLVTLLPKIPIVIAADVVYDDSLTEAFVNTVEKILSLPPKRSVYVALEKRYVFTIADCDSVAPCYEYYLELIGRLKGVKIEEISLDFPKYFQYDRVKELVLWKISSLF